MWNCGQRDQMGAYDYIEKPFSAERPMIIVKRALEAAKLRHENVELKEAAARDGKRTIGNLDGDQHRSSTVEKVAPTTAACASPAHLVD